jgi:hypothetical protein
MAEGLCFGKEAHHATKVESTTVNPLNSSDDEWAIADT